MPFPSTGCQTCKIRRIKCDKTRPTCQRCMKSNRACSPTGDGLMVHTENPFANGRLKRPRGPRSTLTVTCNSTKILQRPSTDLKTSATLYYLHVHLRAAEDTPSILKSVADNFLPVWTSASNCHAMIDLAISSIALAVFSRTQKCPAAAIEASTRYHQLLRVTQVSVSSLDRGNIDACLLAVFFMSRYENIVHEPLPTSYRHLTAPFATSLQGFSHNDGALAILRMWNDRQSKSQPATDVIKHTRRGLIKSALLRNLPIAAWMDNGSLFGEYGAELEYDRIVVRVADIRRRLSMLLKETTTSSPQCSSGELISTAEMLCNEVSDAEQALQDWKANFPPTWCHQRHTLATPTEDFYSSTIYSYSSPLHAAVWIQYYSTRILVTSTCLRVLELIQPDRDDPQRLDCLSTIKPMADDLAFSLPFCLQRFHVTKSPAHDEEDLITLNKEQDLKPSIADLMVWPLTIVSSIADLEVEQRLWFRRQLAGFGRMIGDGVLEFDEAGRWLQL